jgi:hypothetical protein
MAIPRVIYRTLFRRHAVDARASRQDDAIGTVCQRVTETNQGATSRSSHGHEIEVKKREKGVRRSGQKGAQAEDCQEGSCPQEECQEGREKSRQEGRSEGSQESRPEARRSQAPNEQTAGE